MSHPLLREDMFDRPSYADDIEIDWNHVGLRIASTDTPRGDEGAPSWLELSERVLDLAEDSTVSLTQRLRFVALFAGNLDDSFMTSSEQVEPVSTQVHDLVARHATLFRDQVMPDLPAHKLSLLTYAELTAGEQAVLDGVFTRQIQPILTPLAVDPTHPFPYISGLSLNLAVVLGHPHTGREHFARVKVPAVLPRYVRAGESRFVLLEELIRARLPQLFPGLDVREARAFRVTRALQQRERPDPAVRLEVEARMSQRIVVMLLRNLGLGKQALYRVPCALDLTALWSLINME